ncbi:TPR end-of-group domain-containing protein [Methylophaga sp.]|uniref:TPR end-of-group domain-containing protein n=1 Tax=Methylophaga sp. TaxID=2024840 RepID=UPI003F6A12B2
MPRFLAFILITLLPFQLFAAEEANEAQLTQQLEQLQQPVYTPFIERYVLDELKQLRTDMAAQRAELIQMSVDREYSAVDKAVSYATDTVTYFFYLIAAASSVLVLVGWSSIREIKERVHTLADQEINSLISEYEQRLRAIEQQLSLETQQIEENREKIERTQEAQSLWLRAAQETNPASKIAVYDQIMTLRPYDTEALTYKADAVLELDEPQWAVNLCHQALQSDPENGHAFYQLACAHTALQQYDEAVHFLQQAISYGDAYREQCNSDPALAALKSYPGLDELLKPSSDI